MPWVKGREWHNLTQKETRDEVEPSVLHCWLLCISIPFMLRFWFLCGVGCRHLDAASSRVSSLFTNASCKAYCGFLAFFPSSLSGQRCEFQCHLCAGKSWRHDLQPTCLRYPRSDCQAALAGAEAAVQAAWEVPWGTSQYANLIPVLVRH